jgi:hypothetical protein
LQVLLALSSLIPARLSGIENEHENLTAS